MLPGILNFLAPVSHCSTTPTIHQKLCATWSCQHACLAHAPAHHLAQPVHLGYEICRAGYDAPHRRPQALHPITHGWWCYDAAMRNKTWRAWGGL